VIQLHLLRHADAGDPEAWTAPDAQRPLSGKGEKQADRLARFLAGIGFETDAIITSPKLRASQTAEPVAEAIGVPVRVDERLAGGLELATIEAILHSAGSPKRPVFVGHDPDFSELLGVLTGFDAIEMKKGAMARVDIDLPLQAGSGRLAWLVPPDLLKPRS
jgi:phosphohistidine phosphatase SixA